MTRADARRRLQDPRRRDEDRRALAVLGALAAALLLALLVLGLAFAAWRRGDGLLAAGGATAGLLFLWTLSPLARPPAAAGIAIAVGRALGAAAAPWILPDPGLAATGHGRVRLAAETAALRRRIRPLGLTAARLGPGAVLVCRRGRVRLLRGA